MVTECSVCHATQSDARCSSSVEREERGDASHIRLSTGPGNGSVGVAGHRACSRALGLGFRPNLSVGHWGLFRVSSDSTLTAEHGRQPRQYSGSLLEREWVLLSRLDRASSIVALDHVRSRLIGWQNDGQLLRYLTIEILIRYFFLRNYLSLLRRGIHVMSFRFSEIKCVESIFSIIIAIYTGWNNKYCFKILEFVMYWICWIIHYIQRIPLKKAGIQIFDWTSEVNLEVIK